MSIKLIFASTAALALLAGAPAYAAKSQSQQAVDRGGDGGGSGKAMSERKTCQFFDNTASRMKRVRLCLTREEWKKFEEGQQGL